MVMQHCMRGRSLGSSQLACIPAAPAYLLQWLVLGRTSALTFHTTLIPSTDEMEKLKVIVWDPPKTLSVRSFVDEFSNGRWDSGEWCKVFLVNAPGRSRRLEIICSDAR